MEIMLGGGRQTLFWQDAWCRGEALHSRYPEIYNITDYMLVGDLWREGTSDGFCDVYSS